MPNWWINLDWTTQVLWSIAIVASVLLCIQLILLVFDLGQEEENDPARERKIRFVLESPAILVFFAVFGWVGVMVTYFLGGIQPVLIAAFLAGTIGALISRWLLRVFLQGNQQALNVQRAMVSTGKVLRPIPPHRNGFGKVHLHLREAPYELDAITAGKELPAGSAVRVIDVIDNRVLLVEPIDESSAAPPNLPSAPGEPSK